LPRPLAIHGSGPAGFHEPETAATLAAKVNAMSEIDPLPKFLAKTAEEPAAPYLARIEAALKSKGLDPSMATDEFEKMKRHVLHIYQDVESARSFADPAGQVVDCIPFDQQPSVRAARQAGIAVSGHFGPPPRLGRASTDELRTPDRPQPASPCPDGHVLFTRVTLGSLAPWGSLDAYLKAHR
jgi:hypothetical protein